MDKKPLLFFASLPGDLKLLKGKNALLSYYFIKDLPLKKRYKDLKEIYGLSKLFIDSGAFSAFSTGNFINIDKYCYFLKSTNCDYYAGLDVIGNVEKTYQNLKYMEKEKLHPLPTFHFGEDEKYLKDYCSSYDYICLGGMVGRPTKQLELWLDNIFLKYPDNQFHGFGLTITKLCYRYPWFSFDSSSWASHSIYGCLAYNFEKNIIESIAITEGKRHQSNHIDKLKFEKREKWLNLFKEKNISQELLKNDELERKAFNIRAYESAFDYKNDLPPPNLQSPLAFSIPKSQISKFEVSSLRQRTLLNLGIPKPKIYKFHKKCIDCGVEWECKEEDIEKKCKACGSEMVTSPIKTEVKE